MASMNDRPAGGMIPQYSLRKSHQPHTICSNVHDVCVVTTEDITGREDLLTETVYTIRTVLRRIL